MTNVLIIGATSTVGEAVRETLLRETDDILTLFSKDAGELNIDKTRETKISGNTENEDELAQAMVGQDAVFASIGGEDDEFVENIISTMNRNNVLRLVFVTSMGIFDEIPAPEKLENNLDYNEMSVPYNEMIDEVEESDLNYTVVRPGWYTQGDVNYEITEIGDTVPSNGVTIASIADFAKCLLQDPTLYSRQSVGIITPQ
ncbi:NAD(P)H-binding protein [Lactobacillus sp. LL6]|uniref:NAD(P)H-binding protein n=1 Tax=Lactobacillus sp. LL6 TaxID=2596827 RepID=UPI001186982A|nr:NAD(P)H-binding protein [Lactobacillus sp. LL6]TSO26074.1 NAD(P)-dependent oxidoreductase [Lactobacillus sp. LL6]